MSNFCQYNGGYWNDQNTVQYKSVAESQTSSDAMGPFTATKVLAEAIAGADAKIFVLSRTLSQFLFIDPLASLSLSKAFTETVRVNEWLEIKRAGSGWTNEES